MIAIRQLCCLCTMSVVKRVKGDVTGNTKDSSVENNIDKRNSEGRLVNLIDTRTKQTLLIDRRLGWTRRTGRWTEYQMDSGG